MRKNAAEAAQRAESSEFTWKSVFKYNIFPVSVAGLIDRILLHPVDTVATVQQKDNLASKAALQRIYSAGGVRGFYAGFFMPFLSAIPIRVSIYSTYSIVRDYGITEQELSARAAMLMGGIISGCVETTVMCPSDASRTRATFGVKVKNPYTPRVFYRGFTPLLVRTATENTIALAGSDILMGLLPDNLSNIPAMAYVTGTISGALSQFVITPVDTVKTRFMADYSGRSLWSHVRGVWSEGGMFKSAPAKMVRMGIGNGVMLGTIAMVRRTIELIDELKDNDDVGGSNKAGPSTSP